MSRLQHYLENTRLELDRPGSSVKINYLIGKLISQADKLSHDELKKSMMETLLKWQKKEDISDEEVKSVANEIMSVLKTLGVGHE